MPYVEDGNLYSFQWHMIFQFQVSCSPIIFDNMPTMAWLLIILCLDISYVLSLFREENN